MEDEKLQVSQINSEDWQISDVIIQEHKSVTEVAEITLTQNDVEVLLQSITFYLTAISRQTEVVDFYQVMKPLADKYADVQWKLEQFQSQLKQMQNVQSEHL